MFPVARVEKVLILIGGIQSAYHKTTPGGVPSTWESADTTLSRTKRLELGTGRNYKFTSEPPVGAPSPNEVWSPVYIGRGQSVHRHVRNSFAHETTGYGSFLRTRPPWHMRYPHAAFQSPSVPTGAGHLSSQTEMHLYGRNSYEQSRWNRDHPEIRTLDLQNEVACDQRFTVPR